MNTKQKILELAKKYGYISANDIIKQTNMNASGIFRYLKKLVAGGNLLKIGKPPKVLYYYPNTAKNGNEIENKIFNWSSSGNKEFMEPDWLCATQDVFQARVEKLLKDLKTIIGENLSYLLVAVVGEIGNNSFDHNLGNWRDVPGVLFSVDLQNKEIILADRGQGVFATIKRVRPNAESAAEALKIAFTEMISGRSPEQRGNGLKYVSKVINENNLFLRFYSGEARCEISGEGMKIVKSGKIIPGTLAIIKF